MFRNVIKDFFKCHIIGALLTFIYNNLLAMLISSVHGNYPEVTDG